MDKLKFYDELSKRFIEDKKNSKRRFHYEIEKDKESILNCYRKEPFYKDVIDKMELKSRGIFYYKSLVKKQIQKKSNFVKIILKSISEINEKDKKKAEKKRLRGYNVSQLESIRNQKKKLEMRLRSKEKEGMNKYRSMENQNKSSIFLLSGRKCMESIDSNNNNINIKAFSQEKNRIFSGIRKDSEKENLTTLKNNISRSFSLNSIFTNNNNIETNLINEEARIDNFNDLLDQCKKEIKDGDIIGDKMEKFTEKLNKRLSIAKEKRENKVDNNIQDQKIVEDKIKPKQKYKLLEIERFKELKRKLNAKISDNYVYFNRKEFTELVNDKRKDEEYELYYEDTNKVYEKILQNRVKEKNKFNEIKNLLEDSYKKKNYLKNKISSYNNKMKIQLEKESKEKNNFEFVVKEEGKRKDNIGTLVPRLLLKKKEDFGKIKKPIKEKDSL